MYAYRDSAGPAAVTDLWRQLRRILLAAAIIALLSGLSWLSFTSASMSGSLSGAGDMGIIETVMEETEFGRVWVWRLGLATLSVLSAVAGASPRGARAGANRGGGGAADDHRRYRPCGVRRPRCWARAIFSPMVCIC